MTGDRFGNLNSAYAFDGVNDRINSISLNQIGVVSISIWFKPNTFHDGQLINTGADAPNLVVMPQSDSFISSWSWFNASHGFVTSNITYSINEWNHVIYTFNSLTGIVSLYLNGQNVASGTTSINSISFKQNVVFGMREGQLDLAFNGAIDDVRIYNRVLSAQEIQLLYSVTSEVETLPEFCQTVYCDGDNVGIGTPTTFGYKLAVDGDIISEEVKVQLSKNWQWPDYVFEQDYNLNELEQFIKTNKHLPNIPDAKTVKKEGIKLGEMDSKLLEKIEELTLYIINQNKKIISLEKRLDNAGVE